ncbi:MAG: SurA N-terminal domain-containing protein [Bacteroidota bacterium]
MALINTIRQRSGILVGLVAGGLILFLIGGDLLQLSTIISGKNRTNVGKIAGQKIPLQVYQAQVEQLRRLLPTSTSALEGLIREQAWKQLIAQTTLQKEEAALGLTVSDEELVDMVQGDHIHPELQASFQDPKTKQFDKQRLITYLQNLPQMPAAQQAQWRYFERQLATFRNREKFTQLMQQSALITDLEAQAKQEAAHHPRSVKCLYVPYYSYPDDNVSINDAMLKQYLKAHKSAYQVKESRGIQYISLPIEPTAADQQAFQQELQALKKGFAQARDALTFAQVNTDGPPAAASLQLTAQQLPEVLAQQKNRLKKGHVIGPVQEDAVYKLYRVISLPKQPKQSYKIAVIEKQLTPGDQARDQVFRKADYCASTVQDAAQLAAYADQEGLALQDAQVQANDTQVGTLPQARELVRWLYNDAKVGQVSSVFEVGDNYVVAVMTEHVPAGTAPLAQVRDEIALKVRNEHKASLIMAQLQQTSGETLQEKATQYGKASQLLTVKELCLDDDTLDNAGMARRAIGAAFALQPGERTTVADDNGVLIVELVAKNRVESGEDLKAQKQRLQQLTKTMQPYMVFDALEGLAKVKDNRYRFY